MRITWLDIQQKTFKKTLYGFSVDEVFEFLEIVREEVEELNREKVSLREQLHAYEKGITKPQLLEGAAWEFMQKCVQLRVGEASKGDEAGSN